MKTGGQTHRMGSRKRDAPVPSGLAQTNQEGNVKEAGTGGAAGLRASRHRAPKGWVASPTPSPSWKRGLGSGALTRPICQRPSSCKGHTAQAPSPRPSGASGGPEPSGRSPSAHRSPVSTDLRYGDPDGPGGAGGRDCRPELYRLGCARHVSVNIVDREE